MALSVVAGLGVATLSSCSSSGQRSADVAPAGSGSAPACAHTQSVSYITNWDGTSPQEESFWIAESKGYFRDECLDVSYQLGQGSTQVAQLVSSGKFEIGNMAASSLVQVAGTSGTNLKSIFVVIPKDINAWLYYKSSGITSPKDFNGKRLGTTSGSYLLPLLPAFCKAAGCDASKITVQPVQQPGALAALLESHKIDISSEALGQASNAEISQHGAVGEALLSDYLPLVGYCLVASNDTIGKHGDVLTKFVAAMQRATEDIANDPASGVKTAAEYMQTALKAAPSVSAVEGQAVPADKKVMVFDSDHPVGWADTANWTKMVSELVPALKLKPVKVSDIVTNEFVHNAN